MNDFLITYIAAAIEFLSIYIILHRFLELTLIPKPLEILYGLFVIFLLNVIPDDKGNFLWIIGQFCYLLYAVFMANKNIYQGFLLHIITIFSTLLIQFGVIISYSLLFSPKTLSNLAGSLATLLLVFIIFFATPYPLLYKKISNAAKPLHLLLINSYLIFVFVLLIFKTDQTSVYKNPFFLLSILLLILSINIGLLYYDFTLQKKQTELLSHKKNLPIYRALIQDIRANQHEYSNRLQALSLLPATCKDYDSLCLALKAYTKEYSHSLYAYPLLQINMPLLAASLYNLANQAAEKNITVHFNAVSPKLQSQAPEYVVSDLACILLQNAVEASASGDYIYVSIDCKDGAIVFEVRNSSPIFYTKDELQNFFKKEYSTKSPCANSGLGLFYFKRTIERYQGAFGYDCITYNNHIWIVMKFIL